MGWGKEWILPECEDDPKGDIYFGLMPLPPSKSKNEFWSNGGIVHKEMTEADFKNKFGDAILHGQGWSQDGKHIPLKEIYNNIPPTHDPYTNPNAHIYYECNCGAILDPQTKSFAALNNHASKMGWKIRFTDKGYVPYCVKCGEGVE